MVRVLFKVVYCSVRALILVSLPEKENVQSTTFTLIRSLIAYLGVNQLIGCRCELYYEHWQVIKLFCGKGLQGFMNKYENEQEFNDQLTISCVVFRTAWQNKSHCMPSVYLYVWTFWGYLELFSGDHFSLWSVLQHVFGAGFSLETAC